MQIAGTMYNTRRFVKSATVTTDKAVRAATNIIGYAAKDIVAPIIGTAIKSGASAIGSLCHTAAKTGSELISGTKEAYKETKKNISNDSVINEAKKDLNYAKAKIANKLGSFGSSDGFTMG